MAKPAAAGGAAARRKKARRRSSRRRSASTFRMGWCTCRLLSTTRSSPSPTRTATSCRGRVRDRWASADRARALPSPRSRPRRTPPTWRAITVCAAWMCASAARDRAASRRCARWRPLGSKFARSGTSRRFRTTDAVRRKGVACKTRRSVLGWSQKNRGLTENLTENWQPRTENCIGTKGEAKPVNRSSKGEETWHVIQMQSAVFAAARA